jgi:hypothetical protein
MSADLFDIVIPVGPNDAALVASQVEATKRNVIGYRNIYLITHDPAISVDGCVTVYESLFPFSIDTVASAHGRRKRNGWYLQQLIKLYAGLVIPGILDRYLVIDCDTFFMKPTTFIANGKALYAFQTEHHRPYFVHMAEMLPLLTRVDPSKSGICHHMLFETKYVKELMELIESGSSARGRPFHRIFLETVEEKEREFSGASEYELYFNYMCKVHPNIITIRPLVYKGVSRLPVDEDCDYASCHWYQRK